MTRKFDENLFSLVDSIDAFGDGVTLVYKGDSRVDYLESCSAEEGYIEALKTLDQKYQYVRIEAEEWQVAEEWGSEVSQDSLAELIESAKNVGFEVEIIQSED